MAGGTGELAAALATVGACRVVSANSRRILVGEMLAEEWRMEMEDGDGG